MKSLVLPLAIFVGIPALIALTRCHGDLTGKSDGGPPVFTHQTVSEAKAAVAGTNRILVVKGTAAWCPPCKEMDRTTWRDPKVEKWFADNGIVIALDVDQSVADAKALRIMAMPTMVAFKGDVEFDRVMGYQDAEELLGWLNGVKAGKQHGGAPETK